MKNGEYTKTNMVCGMNSQPVYQKTGTNGFFLKCPACTHPVSKDEMWLDTVDNLYKHKSCLDLDVPKDTKGEE